MELKYDREADAIYIYLTSKSYSYGKDLDDERRIDYAADNTPIGVELLCVSNGVNVSRLTNSNEIIGLLEAEGIDIYTLDEYLATGTGDLESKVVLTGVTEGSGEVLPQYEVGTIFNLDLFKSPSKKTWHAIEPEKREVTV